MKALIIGSARCVFEDIGNALKLFHPDIVVAVNDAGAVWAGELTAWASCHPEKFEEWAQQRAQNGHAPADSYWTTDRRTHRAQRPVSTVHSLGGGSGMLAIQVARRLGAQRNVLAGIPMARDYGHFFSGDKPWEAAWLYQRFWVRDQKDLRTDTRSMSGLTAALLGPISREWINGDQDAKAA